MDLLGIIPGSVIVVRIKKMIDMRIRKIVNRGNAGLKFQVKFQVKMKNGIGIMRRINHTHILDYIIIYLILVNHL